MTDAFAIFGAIDTLVLEHVAGAGHARGRRFRCLGTPPSWCAELWPACSKDADDLAPEEIFPFLEVFLDDAEAAWSAEPPGRVDSESWTRVDQAGNETHLQATALRIDACEILLIARCDALHRARQMLLQRARELRIAHDAAGREQEKKDVLLHCIIHDLQAPLSTIASALEALEISTPRSEIERLAAIAADAARRQRELILDILQVFAAEHDERRTWPGGGTDVVDVVRQTLELFEPVARARGLELASTESADRILAVGDRSRVERVVTNLVENAVRNAVARIAVSVTDEDRLVRVAVDDDGAAVPDEMVPELFVRLGDAPGVRAGIGLGLYFCRITVEQWGGKVGYERRREGGTRFWVGIPRYVDRAV